MSLLRYLSPWILLFLMAGMLECAANLPHQVEPTSRGNLFVNGSFEQGREPWFSLVTPNWESFGLTNRQGVHSRHSARLSLRAGEASEGTKIVGAIQEVISPDFPKRLSGSYCIEGWSRGTPKQYLQVVVIVFGDPSDRPFPNYQIRYLLAGIDKPPLQIANARYRLVAGPEIREEKWVRFDFDLHADFQRQWGHVPKGFSKIRVLFEVRYDEKNAGDGVVRADVYYDDLYLGE